MEGYLKKGFRFVEARMARFQVAFGLAVNQPELALVALRFKGADLVGVLQGEPDFVEAVEQVVFAVVVYVELAIV
ncbi:hypothetical protein A7P94_08830 [Eikenella sp. NML01-A-086]|nr:hypothetical protein A7P94_08830 [Eikenella sp. NML01-A-086]